MNSLQLPQIQLQLQSGSTLVLRMSFQSWMKEAILLRPTLDDWVVDEDLVITANQILDPPYIYLFSGNSGSERIKIFLPADVLPGQRLKTWLRFPGIQEEAISIDIEIIPIVEPQYQVIELPLAVTFPVSGEASSGFSHTFNETTAGIFGLISGVIDLDKIPSRWLIAELLIVIAQKGEEYAQTLPGIKLLEQLKQTVFYQNGKIALDLAQLPGWISQSLTIANTILGGSSPTPGTQRLLYIWEQWLLSLVGIDVEAEEVGQQIFVPPFLAEAVVTKFGMDGDRWFGNILLGLSVLSPRINQELATITELKASTPVPNVKGTEGAYALKTSLPGLDFLPVRWLVVELLLVIAQIGKDYVSSKQGKNLSDRLNRTRFFKNGVLALASAKVPRWLHISQSAADSFANSIGAATGMGGMLVFWEGWLWSLLPDESNIKISVPNNSGREALSRELAMNGDLWFEAMILGLAVISPRIAAILEAIAGLATVPANRPERQQTFIEDIVGESKSIQL